MLKYFFMAPNYSFMLRLALFLPMVTLFCGCLSSESPPASEPTEQELEAVLDEALDDPKAFQAYIRESCAKYRPMLLEVADTIHMGSRIWNAGGAPITVRLYEGVAYRVLYEVRNQCPRLSHAFQGGLNRAANKDDINEKGRVLRETLDLIMGGPPTRPPGA